MDLKKTKFTKANIKSKDNRKREPLAKRWCFTLNNPLEGEMIDPDLVEYAVVGEETAPETGTRHFQGFVIFKTKKRLTQCKKILPRAHWEIAKGTVEENYAYCTKDGQFEQLGEKPKTKKRARAEQQDEASTRALNANNVAEGMAIIREDLPFDYLRFGESMERNLKRAKTIPYKPEFKLADFNRQRLIFEKKSILIHGDSNTGKSQFAVAHFKNPLFVTHIDTLKGLSTDHDGVVFDDMSFKHWPVEAVIHLLDYDLPRDINVRYGTVHIPAHTIKVFTHNTDNPFYDGDTISPEQKAAIERRLQRIFVRGPLYTTN